MFCCLRYPCKNVRLLVLLILALLIGSCDSAGSGPTDDDDGNDEGVYLTATERVDWSNGTLEYRTLPQSQPGLGSLAVLHPELSGEYFAGLASQGGIWLARVNNDFEANIATGFSVGVNGFRPLVDDTLRVGYFRLTSDSLNGPIAYWPTDLGAPATFGGDPLLYGDRMIWAAFETDGEAIPAGRPISGIRVGMTMFLFESGPLQRVLFIRYDITNTTPSDITDLHVGYAADMDLWPYGDGDECFHLNHNDNQSGYDLERHLSFTYISPIDSLSYPEHCFGTVGGLAILDMQSPGGLQQPKLAHRIIRERPYHRYGEFSEIHMQSEEAILLALQGLAPDGSPMINPIDDSATKFAFTGDPVDETGWIDERTDHRSLQSLEPFRLASGETRSMTVAMLGASESTFAEGVSSIEALYDTILNNRSSWDF